MRQGGCVKGKHGGVMVKMENGEREGRAREEDRRQ